MASPRTARLRKAIVLEKNRNENDMKAEPMGKQMDAIQVGTFPERLTVNATGMGELNRERDAGLVYELAQNVFDEESASVAGLLCDISKGRASAS